jgi:hypothetical protein
MNFGKRFETKINVENQQSAYRYLTYLKLGLWNSELEVPAYF